MPNEDVIIGVIGLGSIGLRHATNLNNLGYKNIIAFDPCVERQALLEDKGQIVHNRDDIFKKSDAVVIASPNQHHIKDLSEAIKRDCHAFVEKPLSHTLNGLADIQNQALEKNLKIMVGMNVRFNPAIQKLKTSIGNKEYGEVLWGEYTFHAYLPDWRPDSDYSKGYAANPQTGGIIFDAVHGVDILYYLLGDFDVKACVARNSGVLNVLSDDIADILCVHESGVTSRLHMDYITKPKEHSVTIATDRGFMRVDISKRQFEFENSNREKDVILYDETVINDDYMSELDVFLRLAFSNEQNQFTFNAAIKVTEKVINARHIAGLPS